MKSIGIIGEYNPFHQGHRYLIERSVKETGADVVVSVMSGNFTQRGEPAVADKWERAAAAVDNGINVVVELPVVFACNSAEFFAKGAVQILEGIGCIDYLAFGTECGDIEKLKDAADFLRLHEKQINLRARELLRDGNSYPKARECALTELNPAFDASLISEPNNILALEYLMNLRTMQPVTIKRRGSSYHQSGERIRSELYANDPEKFDRMDSLYFSHIAAQILKSDPDDLERIFAADKGLSSRMKNEIRYVDSADHLIDRIKSKAYTRTRISRMLSQVLLGIDDAGVQNAVPYIRILALDRKGGQFIKEVKKRGCCTLPLLTNINKEKGEHPEILPTLQKDILASDMYNLLRERDLYEYSDYIKLPYVRRDTSGRNRD